MLARGGAYPGLVPPSATGSSASIWLMSRLRKFPARRDFLKAGGTSSLAGGASSKPILRCARRAPCERSERVPQP
eukprot:scaffold261741_cov28-Tisochrysis_lutea.AAC.3